MQSWNSYNFLTTPYIASYYVSQILSWLKSNSIANYNENSKIAVKSIKTEDMLGIAIVRILES